MLTVDQQTLDSDRHFLEGMGNHDGLYESDCCVSTDEIIH
jgi:hypothetical protein